MQAKRVAENALALQRCINIGAHTKYEQYFMIVDDFTKADGKFLTYVGAAKAVTSGYCNMWREVSWEDDAIKESINHGSVVYVPDTDSVDIFISDYGKYGKNDKKNQN